MIVTFIWIMTTHAFKRETKEVLKTPRPGEPETTLNERGKYFWWANTLQLPGLGFLRLLLKCLVPATAGKWAPRQRPARRLAAQCFVCEDARGSPFLYPIQTSDTPNKNRTFKVSGCGNTENTSFPTQFNHSQRLFKSYPCRLNSF